MRRIIRILVNLGETVPAQFARFERLLEVVGNEDDELAAGRERYRFYRDRGYALNDAQARRLTEHRRAMRRDKIGRTSLRETE